MRFFFGPSLRLLAVYAVITLCLPKAQSKLGIVAVAKAQTADLASGANDVLGIWRIIDDKRHTPTAEVALSLENGLLVGKVVAMLDKTHGEAPVCERCQDARKDQPIIGMTVVWGLKPKGDAWVDGSILDPGNGSTYRCKLQLRDPEHLEVRGYLGAVLFGRSQVWQRAKPQKSLSSAGAKKTAAHKPANPNKPER